MLNRWYQVFGIAAATVVIIATVAGPSIGGIFWLARLDHEVTELQTDVTELQTDVDELQTNVSELQTDIVELQTNVSELQTDVDELKRGQAIILDILQNLANEMPELRNDLDKHIHDPDGGTQFPAGR